MRITALIGCVAVLAACSTKDTPPADTTAAMPAPAPAMSASAVSGMWNVNVMPMGKDTVVTSYTLNATDTASWKFVFAGRTDTVTMKVTGMSGDTLLSEAGPFASGVQKGKQVSVKSKSWLQDGKLMSLVDAHYDGTPADSVVKLRSEGTRQ